LFIFFENYFVDEIEATHHEKDEPVECVWGVSEVDGVSRLPVWLLLFVKHVEPLEGSPGMRVVLVESVDKTKVVLASNEKCNKND
jgi:hypothetical protein